MENLDISKFTDRELQVLLFERVSVMGLDIKSLKDGTTAQLATLQAKVDNLEQHKADKAEVTSAFEKMIVENSSRSRQISRLTNYLWFAFGALGVLEIALQIFLRIYK